MWKLGFFGALREREKEDIIRMAGKRRALGSGEGGLHVSMRRRKMIVLAGWDFSSIK